MAVRMFDPQQRAVMVSNDTLRISGAVGGTRSRLAVDLPGGQALSVKLGNRGSSARETAERIKAALPPGYTAVITNQRDRSEVLISIFPPAPSTAALLDSPHTGNATVRNVKVKQGKLELEFMSRDSAHQLVHQVVRRGNVLTVVVGDYRDPRAPAREIFGWERKQIALPNWKPTDRVVLLNKDNSVLRPASA